MPGSAPRQDKLGRAGQHRALPAAGPTWMPTLTLVTILATSHGSPARAQETTPRDIHQLKLVVLQQEALMRQQAAALQAQAKTLASLQRRLAEIEAQQKPTRPKPAETQAALPGSLTVSVPGKVPPPGQTNVAVTQQPGNLPGRSVMPPYTVPDLSPTGSTPPTLAAPVSSAGDRIRLSLSGQVSRMELYGNDGRNSAVRNVDNENSSTRVRFVGEGQLSAAQSGGMNIEAELKPNSSASTPLTQNLPQPASASPFTVRQAEAYFRDSRYGEVRLGYGGTASYQTVEVDLSGTGIASYPSISDFDGGFAFRQRRPALVPAAGGAFVRSPADAYGPSVASVFNFFGGLVRDNRIRYDTPFYRGFQASASLVDGGAFDVALRYAGEFDGNQLAGAVAFADAESRNHILLTNGTGYLGAPSNLYGYAGVPTGANGSLDLATPVSPNAGDVSANGSRQVDGSVSLLLKNGLSVTLAGGLRDVRYRDPQGRALTPTLLYGKLGYQTEIFPSLGISAFSVDAAQNVALQFSGDRARAYGAQYVQFIKALAMELFLSGKIETLHRTYATYNDLLTLALGARVKF